MERGRTEYRRSEGHKLDCSKKLKQLKRGGTELNIDLPGNTDYRAERTLNLLNHRYVEPFAGAAALFFLKEPSPVGVRLPAMQCIC